MESVRLLSYSYKFAILNEDDCPSPAVASSLELRHGPREVTPQTSIEYVHMPTPVPSALKPSKSLSGTSLSSMRLSEMELMCYIKCRLYFKDEKKKLQGKNVEMEVSNATSLLKVLDLAVAKITTLAKKKTSPFRVYKVQFKTFKNPVELDVREFRDALVDDFMVESKFALVVDFCGRMQEKYSNRLPIKAKEWVLDAAVAKK